MLAIKSKTIHSIMTLQTTVRLLVRHRAVTLRMAVGVVTVLDRRIADMLTEHGGRHLRGVGRISPG